MTLSTRSGWPRPLTWYTELTASRFASRHQYEMFYIFSPSLLPRFLFISSTNKFPPDFHLLQQLFVKKNQSQGEDEKCCRAGWCCHAWPHSAPAGTRPVSTKEEGKAREGLGEITRRKPHKGNARDQRVRMKENWFSKIKHAFVFNLANWTMQLSFF